MPRRREVAKRVILPDPKYGDRVVAKLVNIIMFDGKKSTAERALYGALEIVSEKVNEEPVKILKKSLDNIKPCWRLNPGGLVVPPIRCLSRLGRSVGFLLPCVGWLSMPMTDRRRLLRISLPVKFWMPITTVAQRSRNAKIRTRWPKPTGLLLTTAGSFI